MIILMTLSARDHVSLRVFASVVALPCNSFAHTYLKDLVQIACVLSALVYVLSIQFLSLIDIETSTTAWTHML